MGFAHVNAIKEWLLERLAGVTGLPPGRILPAAEFADLGLSSSEVATLTGELEIWLDLQLPLSLFYEHKTVAAVAEAVHSLRPADPERPVYAAVTGTKDARERLAIVGMACRFPGAPDLGSFWRLLQAGKDAISEVPKDRWDGEGLFDAEPGTPGKMNTRHGGFLEGIDQFDAMAFGISPREAERMDPQQRLLLEIAWQAFEDAGLTRESLRQSSTSVFVGLSNLEYRGKQFSDPRLVDVYAGTGNAASIVANRISYFFDLVGPSLTIDTACSSSLSAIHLASQSLRSGESKVALVGSVNTMLMPEFTMVFAQAGLLSPDGKCRAFDAAASGYVRGEGVAAIVLKTESAAVADGDRIHGLILGSAVNQDGRTLALTAPSRAAQESMLRSACAAAGVLPNDISYVEAHGTATPVGDVIETAALSTVLGKGRPKDRPLLIGSVKTNIGHTECVAGLAGLIKTVLALSKGSIPPSLHFDTPNPRIGFEHTSLRVVTAPTPWPSGMKRRLAGVSSFGFGGTNAHVLLEAPSVEDSQEDQGASRATWLLPVSARSEAGLKKARGILVEALREQPELKMCDLAFTLAGRETYGHRCVVLAGGPGEAIGELEAGGGYAGVAEEGKRGVGFVFGSGAEVYAGMGAGLYRSERLYRLGVDECCGWLSREMGLDVLDILREPVGEWGEIRDRESVDAALFVRDYAMARLLEFWGVVPEALLGYGVVGEYVAATLAGVFSLEDALRVVATRGRLSTEVEQGERLFGEMSLHAPQVPMVSPASGDWVESAEAMSPRYWLRRLQQPEPVRCGVGLARLLEGNDRVLLEIGSGEDLRASVRQLPQLVVDGATPQPLLSVCRAAANIHSDEVVLATALGQLWIAGVPVNWRKFWGEHRRRLLSLPTYPFQRSRYWIDVPRADEDAATPVPDSGKRDSTDWFYRPEWIPRALPSGTPGYTGSCLLMAGPGSAAERLHASLIAQGRRTILALQGQHFQANKDDLRAGPRYFLNLQDEQQCDQLCRALSVQGDHPVQVVFLSAPALDAAPSSSFHALAGWTRAMNRQRWTAPMQLDVVVGTAASSGASRGLVQGLMRSIPQEFGHITCRLIETDALVSDVSIPAGLVDELTALVPDVEVGWHSGVRHVRAFEPVSLPPLKSGAHAFRDKGVYLITGGLGGIGMALAQFLAREHRATVILTGRSGLPAIEAWEGELARLGEEEPLAVRLRGMLAIEEAGGRALVFAADVSNEPRMREVVAESLRLCGRIDGVIHAAGLATAADLVPVISLDRSRAEEKFQAKLDGTGVLARVFADAPPDFIIVMSSISSVLGGFGFAAYAAANAAMSVVAENMSQERTAWYSVHWDTWITAASQSASTAGSSPTFSMTVDEGVAALRRVLASGERRLVHSIGDLNTRLSQWVSGAFVEARRKPASAAADLPLYARPKLANAYVQATGETEKRVACVYQNVLGIAEIGLNDNFFDMGGTSLSALQLAAGLQAEFHTPVSPVLLFEAPTVAQLARHLVAEPQQAERQDIELKQRLLRRRSLSQRSGEQKIAIVGRSGRFPGARNVPTLWENLVQGRESLSHFTDADLLASGIKPSVFRSPNYVRVRSILDDIDKFDAAFFGYTPREAEFMDPQHRLFLECAWEALEAAGYDPWRFDGAIGVFAGCNISCYGVELIANSSAGENFVSLDGMIAHDKDSLTTTVSYKLNLRGPSVSVQTFCSTSLVAVHIACQSLRTGESDLVLAGGVSLRVPTKFGYQYAPGGQESRDGHTRSFDAQATGTLFGDGVAIVALKRLEDALADGDQIHGVIRGSAINNDGAGKAGYTAPSVTGQAEVVAAAMAAAGVDPEEISYVEAHGSATELGDPIEVTALNRAFRLGTSKRAYCALGSVKSNFGHLDRASGVTGLIKVIESLKHEVIPATLHFTKPNPRIDLEDSPFFVNTGLRPWPRSERPRLAGVNALGIGGTNVHVIVEEAPVRESSTASRAWQILPLSARTGSALNAQRELLARHLESHPEQELADVAFTLQQGRREFRERQTIVCRSHADAARALRAGTPAGSSTAADAKPAIAFLFPGVGDHYVNMAAGLYADEEVFRNHLDECLTLLREDSGVDLAPHLFPANGGPAANMGRLFFRGAGPEQEQPLQRTELAQPAVFAIEYSLARLLMKWRIQPDALIGYSVGEFAAATIAGTIALRDALRLVAARAKLIAKLDPGVMLAVPLSSADVAALLDQDLSLAVASGPGMVVVAGPETAIAALELRLAARDVVSRRLQASHAFHTPMMLPAVPALREILAGIKFHVPAVPYVSNVSGTWITESEATDPEYWIKHMCGTVRFNEGLEELMRRQGGLLVEVGPGQGLTSLVRQHPATRESQANLSAVPSMRTMYGQEQDSEMLLGAIGKLWAAGAVIDWRSYRAGEHRHRVELPTYPFERSRYWIDTAKPQPETVGRLQDIGDWFYEENWLPAPLAPATEPFAAASLVFTSKSPAGPAVVAALRREGRMVFEVHACAGPLVRSSETTFQADPQRPEQLHELCALLRQQKAELGHVIYLWTLTNDPEHGSLQNKGFFGLLGLVQALGENQFIAPIRLDVVSNRLYAARKSDCVDPARATVIGAYRVIPQEYPNITVRSIDVEDVLAGPGAAAADGGLIELQRELTTQTSDVAIAYRGDERLVQTYQPLHLEPVSAASDALRQKGVYLITGGLGNVGLTLAQMLTSGYGAKVALVARRPFPAAEQWQDWLASHPNGDETSAKIRALLQMESGDGRVAILQADVSDETRMREVFASVEARFGVVHGVFHAAGVITGDAHCIIAELKPEHLSAHFAAKVEGTRVLARLIDERKPDFCMLFSSLASTLGGIAYSGYAAANAFEDGFALARRESDGTRWVSVNWDTWAREHGEQDHKGTTLEAFLMWPEEGAEAVRRVLGSSRAARLVNSTADFGARLDQWVYRKQLSRRRETVVTSHYARPELSTSFVAASNKAEKRVARVFQDVLGIESVGLHDNFFELGGNSLLSLQIIAELQREFAIQLSPILIFEASTISELAKRLVPAGGEIAPDRMDSDRMDSDRSTATPAEARRSLHLRSRSSGRGNDIAIIGMAGRFPGATRVEELWNSLLAGEELITFFSDAELRAAGVDDLLLANPAYVKARGIVENIELFDAAVFGFNPREVELMDPQHRIMLEIAWETIENAGYDSHRFHGRVGVFAGTMPSLYQTRLQTDPALWKTFDPFEANLGNTLDSLATRISYKLDLSGPSLSIGTYCSTAGVAIHLACQSLRVGESDMALCGGISLKVPTIQGHLFEPGNQSSPDGHTRTFDARAQGTVFSDGGAMLLLKRLDDALEDGDTIHAVIKGTAINNDGSMKAGFTAPSVERQAEVISLALEDAGLLATDIHYIEAHGTATELGDPIEVAALTRAFREAQAPAQSCLLGSIKTNMGHTDRAAGAIGVIKAVQILKTGLVPPTLHFDRPNPKMDLSRSPFRVNTSMARLPDADAWRAGVTTLGVGGTNSHIVLERSPEPAAITPGRNWHVLPLSAKVPEALNEMCANLAAALACIDEAAMADVAFTLQCGRKEFGQRLVVYGRDRAELVSALRDPESNRRIRHPGNIARRPVAFVFPGVGEQYVNMGAGLYATEPSFRADMDTCFELLRNEADLDLFEIIFASGIEPLQRQKAMLSGETPAHPNVDRLNVTRHAQPATFVLEYCLCQLLMRQGLMPEALLGYSLGEFAAAAVAGVLSLGDALRIVAARARIIDALPQGAMLAVPLPADKIIPMLGPALQVAISNGRRLTVVAGPIADIESLQARLKEREVVSRLLPATHAFHSRMMEAAASPLRQALQNVRFQAPTVRVLSNVTGTWLTDQEAKDPEYWIRHLCQTARFSECIQALISAGEWAFVEVGPGQSLISLIRQELLAAADDGGGVVVQTMRSGYTDGEDEAMLAAAFGRLWAAGNTPDWHAYYRGEKRRRIPLPTYPYQRRRYWIEPEKPRTAGGSQIFVEGQRALLEDFFYIPLWKKVELLAAAGGTAEGCWLILGNAAGLGKELAAKIAALGGEPVLALRGHQFTPPLAGICEIRPAVGEDYVALLRALRLSGKPPSRIVHLWSAGEETFGSLASDLELALENSFYSLFYLAQAIGDQLADKAIELCIVTSDLDAVLGCEEIHPDRAAIKGPCKVLRQEYANIVTRCIDAYSAQETGRSWPAIAQRVLDEVFSAGADQFVAYRGTRRYLPALGPIKIEEPLEDTPRLRESGVYLITGGMGGIGLALAQFLFERYHARLVLVGRQALPPQSEWGQIVAGSSDDRITQRIRALQAMVQSGAELMTVQADIANELRMRDVVKSAIEHFGSLDGVFHAAGVPAQGLTQFKSANVAAEVMAPKIQGTLALHRALTGIPVRFLVLFSSIAALTGGGPGQIEYCASNAFMDSFAQKHRDDHGITISINFGEWQWDAWSDGLKGFQPELRASLIAQRQRYGITFEEGMEAIRRVLCASVPQLVVVSQDAPAMVAASNVCTAAKLGKAVSQAGERRQTTYPRPALAAAFVEATGEMERQIASVWQQVLGIDRVGLRDNFFDLGGNSLVGLQIIAELRKLDVEVATLALYQAPTVEALARLLIPAPESENKPTGVEQISLKQRKNTKAGTSNDIAIIGMSGRFPGAGSPEELWQNVAAGIESVTFYSESELRDAGVSPALIQNPRYVRAGYTVEGFDLFDARLFGFAPREAEFIDPQHRLFLECAWEALEDAACDTETYPGLIGIFAGANSSTYLNNLLSRPDLTNCGIATWQAHVATSNDSLATRVAYKLNLRGPAMSVQTFCSSSGVAIHTACVNLLHDECDMALAGGVSINISGKAGYLHEEGSIDSPDGHTRTFDAHAGGAVTGDGVALVVLKRLSAAIAEGDQIYAVVKGSALNNDGSFKVGYTAPSVEGQARVVAGALAAAGVEAETVGYVEAHGTATELGDPIEVAALSKGYGRSRGGEKYCALGAVKTYVGHLDRAAGVTGVIKAALSLKYETITPVLHYESPNPKLALEQTPFYVPTKSIAWPRGERVRRAGVNVVGLGGTNVHFILEEAPVTEPSGPGRQAELLMLSARTEPALQGGLERLASYLREHPEVALADVAYTLQTGRKRLEYRAAVVGRDGAQAARALAGQPAAGEVSRGQVAAGAKPTVVFLFPGVGDHYPDMAVDLYRSEAVFRDEVDHCCRLLEPMLGLDLRQHLFTPAGLRGERAKPDLKAMLSRGSASAGVEPLHQTRLAQPAVFVMEYCLAHLLMSWGIVPGALIGYSVGEYVAATVSGSLGLEDALQVVAQRARLIDGLPGGSMLAVPLGEQELSGRLGNGVWIGICNSPKLTVVSGETAAIELLERQLNEAGVVSRRLPSSHAFHTPMMEGAGAGLREVLAGVRLHEPRIPYLSNLSGQWIEPGQAGSPEYWVRQMCGTVRFAEGIGELLKDRGRVLVEVGGGQSLSSFVRQHPAHAAGSQPVVPLVQPAWGESTDAEFLQGALGRLWVAGIEPVWEAFYAGQRRLKVALPTYAFDRQRYWVDPGQPLTLAPAEDTGKLEDITQWFYEPVWRESNRKPGRRRENPDRWLIFDDTLGYSRAVVQALRVAGETRILTVSLGDSYARLTDDHFQIRAGHAEDYDRLVRTLEQQKSLPSRIAHFFSVTGAPVEEEAQPGGIKGAMERGYYSLLWIVQAFGKRSLLDPLDIVMISSSMQQVSAGEPIVPGKATLLSPCKGIPQETPHVLCRSVDITLAADQVPNADLIRALAVEVRSDAPDPVVAYRGGRRYVQDFAQLPVEAGREDEHALREEGVYLITGGLGGVGLVLAGHLARRVHARLVLMGRSPMPARDLWSGWIEQHGDDNLITQKIRKVLALEAAGACVELFAGDSGDPAQMRSAVDLARQRFGALHGVVHAAGMTEQWTYRVIQDVGTAETMAQMRPKVDGMYALAQALGDAELDFCLLTSSLSSVLCGITYIPYAAANMFMDAFTRLHNRSARTKWISVNWDTWRLREGQHATIGRTVLEYEMSPEEGAESFERLILRRPADQVVQSTGSLHARIAQWIQRPFEARQRGAFKQQTNLYTRPDLATSFAPVSSEVETRVAEVWQQVLGIDKVGAHDNYFDLGGNSLSAIQVVAELQRAFKRPLSAIVIFEAPTVYEMARRLGAASGPSHEEELKSSIERRKSVRGRNTRGGQDIAIIGMSGRFPGAATIDAFWDNLVHGRESLKILSEEELAAAGVPRDVFKDPRYVPARPVVDGQDLFDARFFGYSPIDAQVSDPQQKLLLEVAWETMEIAGYDAQRYDGLVGVFAGSNNCEYAFSLIRDPETFRVFERPEAGLANNRDSLTTTISYKLNLKGPSYCVQTFCSTSLVAVHIAAQNLNAGECDMALAGGVSLRIPQRQGYLYEEGGLQSMDGHSRSFDANASGTVFGEGVGMVLLKRLEDALADGDTIHAVIKGTAVNNDGAMKAGYSAPSVEGQATAIAMALDHAEVDPRTIDYVEASGTASELGDPIEVAALTRAFRAFTGATQFCTLGSIKPNVGHPDRAAGVLGLIKTVEAIKHRVIPPTLFFEQPNPRIDFANSPFVVRTEIHPWEKVGAPRRAAVNSVGTGGTNAHVILEEAPAQAASEPGRDIRLLLLSAKTATALNRMAANLHHALLDQPDVNLDDLAYTLQVGRSRFAHRRAIIFRDYQQVLSALQPEGSRRALEQVADSRTPSCCFFFAGVSGSLPAAAAELYRGEPAFKAEVDRCLEVFERVLDIDTSLLKAAFQGAEGEFIAAAQFAAQYAAAKLLIGWGVTPDVMAAEGSGSLVAGALCGCLTLEDAVRLTAARDALLASRLECGAPATADWSEPECRSLLAAFDAIPPAASQAGHIQFGGNVEISANETITVSQWIEALSPRPQAISLKGHFVLDLCPSSDMASSVIGAEICRLWQPGESGDTGEARLAATLGWLFVRGFNIDWSAYHVGGRRYRIPLPTYPFERERYWIDAVQPAESSPGVEKIAAGPSKRVEEWISTPVWRELGVSPTVDPTAYRWIVFADDGLLSRRLVQWLAERGASHHQERVFWLEAQRRPASLAALSQLLRETPTGAGQTALPLRVLYFVTEDRGGVPSETSSRVLTNDSPSLGGEDVAASLSILADLRVIYEELHLLCPGLVVTSGTCRVIGAENLEPGRALLLAGDEDVCRVVDIEPQATAPEDDAEATDALIQDLVAEACVLPAKGAEALRGGRRWRRTVEPLLLPSGQGRPFALRRGGAYLISDGLSDFALTLGQQLALGGASGLVLTSALPLPPYETWEDLIDTGSDHSLAQALWQLRVIEELGCKVQIVPMVAVCAEEMTRLTTFIRERFGALDGAFYIERIMPVVECEGDCARLVRERCAALRAFAEGLASIQIGVTMLLAASCVVADGMSPVERQMLSSYQDALAAMAPRKRRMVSVVCEGWPTLGEVPWERFGDALWRIVQARLSQALIRPGLPDAVQRKKSAQPPQSASSQSKLEVRYPRPELEQPYMAPRDELQGALVKMWEELLGIDGVGIEDNFFELGGHSLMGTRLFARVNREMAVQLKLRSIFDSPTISGQARVIEVLRWCEKDAVTVDGGESMEGEI